MLKFRPSNPLSQRRSSITFNELQLIALIEKGLSDNSLRGFLYKRSSSNAKWRLKWFLLFENLLFYFDVGPNSHPPQDQQHQQQQHHSHHCSPTSSIKSPSRKLGSLIRRSKQSAATTSATTTKTSARNTFGQGTSVSASATPIKQRKHALETSSSVFEKSRRASASETFQTGSRLGKRSDNQLEASPIEHQLDADGTNDDNANDDDHSFDANGNNNKNAIAKKHSLERKSACGSNEPCNIETANQQQQQHRNGNNNNNNTAAKQRQRLSSDPQTGYKSSNNNLCQLSSYYNEAGSSKTLNSSSISGVSGHFLAHNEQTIGRSTTTTAGKTATSSANYSSLLSRKIGVIFLEGSYCERLVDSTIASASGLTNPTSCTLQQRASSSSLVGGLGLGPVAGSPSRNPLGAATASQQQNVPVASASPSRGSNGGQQHQFQYQQQQQQGLYGNTIELVDASRCEQFVAALAAQPSQHNNKSSRNLEDFQFDCVFTLTWKKEGSKEYQFRTETEAECLTWVHAISNARYSTLLNDKERLEQKYLHLSQIIESESTAKWQYSKQCEEFLVEIKKLRQEICVLKRDANRSNQLRLVLSKSAAIVDAIIRHQRRRQRQQQLKGTSNNGNNNNNTTDLSTLINNKNSPTTTPTTTTTNSTVNNPPVKSSLATRQLLRSNTTAGSSPASMTLAGRGGVGGADVTSSSIYAGVAECGGNDGLQLAPGCASNRIGEATSSASAVGALVGAGKCLSQQTNKAQANLFRREEINNSKQTGSRISAGIGASITSGNNAIANEQQLDDKLASSASKVGVSNSTATLFPSLSSSGIGVGGTGSSNVSSPVELTKRELLMSSVARTRSIEQEQEEQELAVRRTRRCNSRLSSLCSQSPSPVPSCFSGRESARSIVGDNRSLAANSHQLQRLLKAANDDQQQQQSTSTSNNNNINNNHNISGGGDIVFRSRQQRSNSEALKSLVRSSVVSVGGGAPTGSRSKLATSSSPYLSTSNNTNNRNRKNSDLLLEEALAFSSQTIMSTTMNDSFDDSLDCVDLMDVVEDVDENLRVELKNVVNALNSGLLLSDCLLEVENSEEIKKIKKVQGFFRGWLCRRRWKQIVQEYIKSPHAESMRKRNNLVFRMVECEEEYVEQLTLLISAFLRPIKMAASSQKPALDHDELNSIFLNSETLLFLHQIFLKGLTARMESWPTLVLGDLFNMLLPMLQIYQEYVRNHHFSLQVLAECKQREQFSHILRRLEEKPQLNGRTLETFLTYPMHQIPRYIICLHEILAHTPHNHVERKSLYEAQTKLEELSRQMQDEVSETENIRQNLAIERMIIGGCDILLDVNQVFVRQGILMQVVEQQSSKTKSARSRLASFASRASNPSNSSQKHHHHHHHHHQQHRHHQHLYNHNHYNQSQLLFDPLGFGGESSFQLAGAGFKSGSSSGIGGGGGGGGGTSSSSSSFKLANSNNSNSSASNNINANLVNSTCNFNCNSCDNLNNYSNNNFFCNNINCAAIDNSNCCSSNNNSGSSSSKELIRQCFLFTNHLLVCTRTKDGKLHQLENIGKLSLCEVTLIENPLEFIQQQESIISNFELLFQQQQEFATNNNDSTNSNDNLSQAANVAQVTSNNNKRAGSQQTRSNVNHNHQQQVKTEHYNPGANESGTSFADGATPTTSDVSSLDATTNKRASTASIPAKWSLCGPAQPSARNGSSGNVVTNVYQPKQYATPSARQADNRKHSAHVGFDNQDAGNIKDSSSAFQNDNLKNEPYKPQSSQQQYNQSASYSLSIREAGDEPASKTASAGHAAASAAPAAESKSGSKFELAEHQQHQQASGKRSSNNKQPRGGIAGYLASKLSNLTNLASGGGSNNNSSNSHHGASSSAPPSPLCKKQPANQSPSSSCLTANVSSNGPGIGLFGSKAIRSLPFPLNTCSLKDYGGCDFMLILEPTSATKLAGCQMIERSTTTTTTERQNVTTAGSSSSSAAGGPLASSANASISMKESLLLASNSSSNSFFSSAGSAIGVRQGGGPSSNTTNSTNYAPQNHNNLITSGSSANGSCQPIVIHLVAPNLQEKAAWMSDISQPQSYQMDAAPRGHDDYENVQPSSWPARGQLPLTGNELPTNELTNHSSNHQQMNDNSNINIDNQDQDSSSTASGCRPATRRRRLAHRRQYGRSRRLASKFLRSQFVHYDNLTNRYEPEDSWYRVQTFDNNESGPADFESVSSSGASGTQSRVKLSQLGLLQKQQQPITNNQYHPRWHQRMHSATYGIVASNPPTLRDPGDDNKMLPGSGSQTPRGGKFCAKSNSASQRLLEQNLDEYCVDYSSGSLESCSAIDSHNNLHQDHQHRPSDGAASGGGVFLGAKQRFKLGNESVATTASAVGTPNAKPTTTTSSARSLTYLPNLGLASETRSNERNSEDLRLLPSSKSNSKLLGTQQIHGSTDYFSNSGSQSRVSAGGGERVVRSETIDLNRVVIPSNLQPLSSPSRAKRSFSDKNHEQQQPVHPPRQAPTSSSYSSGRGPFVGVEPRFNSLNNLAYSSESTPNLHPPKLSEKNPGKQDVVVVVVQSQQRTSSSQHLLTPTSIPTTPKTPPPKQCIDNVHFNDLFHGSVNDSSSVTINQSVRSDPRLHKDDVDIKFSRALNSCKLPQIRYASKERLFERLTDLRFLSIDFLNTFLLTYRVFTSAEDVLEALKSVHYNCDRYFSQQQQQQQRESVCAYNNVSNMNHNNLADQYQQLVREEPAEQRSTTTPVDRKCPIQAQPSQTGSTTTATANEISQQQVQKPSVPPRASVSQASQPPASPNQPQQEPAHQDQANPNAKFFLAPNPSQHQKRRSTISVLTPITGSSSSSLVNLQVISGKTNGNSLTKTNANREAFFEHGETSQADTQSIALSNSDDLNTLMLCSEGEDATQHTQPKQVTFGDRTRSSSMTPTCAGQLLQLQPGLTGQAINCLNVPGARETRANSFSHISEAKNIASSVRSRTLLSTTITPATPAISGGNEHWRLSYKKTNSTSNVSKPQEARNDGGGAQFLSANYGKNNQPPARRASSSDVNVTFHVTLEPPPVESYAGAGSSTRNEFGKSDKQHDNDYTEDDDYDEDDDEDEQHAATNKVPSHHQSSSSFCPMVPPSTPIEPIATSEISLFTGSSNQLQVETQDHKSSERKNKRSSNRGKSSSCSSSILPSGSGEGSSSSSPLNSISTKSGLTSQYESGLINSTSSLDSSGESGLLAAAPDSSPQFAMVGPLNGKADVVAGSPQRLGRRKSSRINENVKSLILKEIDYNNSNILDTSAESSSEPNDDEDDDEERDESNDDEDRSFRLLTKLNTVKISDAAKSDDDSEDSNHEAPKTSKHLSGKGEKKKPTDSPREKTKCENKSARAAPAKKLSQKEEVPSCNIAKSEKKLGKATASDANKSDVNNNNSASSPLRTPTKAPAVNTGSGVHKSQAQTSQIQAANTSSNSNLHSIGSSSRTTTPRCSFQYHSENSPGEKISKAGVIITSSSPRITARRSSTASAASAFAAATAAANNPILTQPPMSCLQQANRIGPGPINQSRKFSNDIAHGGRYYPGQPGYISESGQLADTNQCLCPTYRRASFTPNASSALQQKQQSRSQHYPNCVFFHQMTAGSPSNTPLNSYQGMHSDTSSLCNSRASSRLSSCAGLEYSSYSSVPSNFYASCQHQQFVAATNIQQQQQQQQKPSSAIMMTPRGSANLLTTTPGQRSKRNSTQINIRSVATIRVLSVLRHWVSKHSQDFVNDAKLFHLVQEFLQDLIIDSNLLPAEHKAAVQLQQMVQKAAHSRGNQVDLDLLLAPPPKSSPDSIETLSALEIAEGMTYLDHKIFLAIRSEEFLGQAWMKMDKAIKAPHILLITKHFNDVSRLVASEIIRVPELHRRVAVIEKWTNVAHICRVVHNFNGVLQICAAFTNSAVFRLKKTWDKIPKTTKTTIDQLQNLVSTDSRFRNMRDAINRCDPPSIPYVGMYLTDLSFIEEGTPNYSPEGLLNFSKMRMIAHVIREIQHLQNGSYKIELNPRVVNYLLDASRHLQDDEMYRCSLVIEPKSSGGKSGVQILNSVANQQQQQHANNNSNGNPSQQQASGQSKGSHQANSSANSTSSNQNKGT